MVKIQQIATDVEELAEEIDGEKPDSEALDILAELGAFPGDDNWRFTVSQVLGASRDGVKEPQIYEGDASIIEGLHTRLRDEFGQGKFRVKVYKNKRLYARKDIEVASPPKSSTPPERQSEMATVLAAMEKQNERIIQLLSDKQQSNIQPTPQQPQNPFDLVTQIVGVMTSLQTMMQPKVDATMSTVDAVLKGVELATKIRGGDEGDNGEGEVSLLGLVRDVVRGPIGEKILTQIMNQPVPGQAQQPQSGQVIVQNPITQQSPAIVTPTLQPNQMQTDANATAIQTYIRNQLIYLVGRAKNNSDALAYADYVIDNWPADILLKMVREPNLLQIVHATEPATIPYSGWFKQLVDEVVRLVKDGIAADGDNTDAPGQTNSANNAHGNPGRDRGRQGDVAQNVGIGEEFQEELNN